MKLKADRPTIVVGCSVGLIALVVLYWVLHFWWVRQSYAQEIETIQPRTARLLGMVDSAGDLRQAADRASSILQALAYSAERDRASTAAAMQQEIRELMTAAGLSVSGSQILPKLKNEEFDWLSLDITAEGNANALEEALSSLESMRPLVFVQSLNVRPARVSRSRRRGAANTAPGDPRKLTARFSLITLRLKD